jgi:hypothetical protein
VDEVLEASASRTHSEKSDPMIEMEDVQEMIGGVRVDLFVKQSEKVRLKLVRKSMLLDDKHYYPGKGDR